MQVPASTQKTLTVASNRNFESFLPIRCVAPQRILRFFAAGFAFAFAFAFAFGNSARYCVVLLNAPLSDREKKKAVCNGFVFPGNLDPLSLTPGGPIVLLVCEFRRRDNLLAWRELFANLYELESRIGFWKEYNHFERIYWVHRFDRFSSNFRQNILGIMARKECREILIFKIFVSWCPFTQHISHIFSLQP